ncbi:TPA: hypothetical protein DIU27_02285 [Candidatus Collierbacteria bacterium]|uniref:Uncharacterized protein n=1 Tax=Candidatus Collierbacteria bacterium GW2011_GWB2_44_22 TaxID=1618387 RepID=A0A0G1KVM9_9BACT|nr:MAG: hypothetical protein UW31_C0009G0049 [Candidatus Collierbacteria bacterium GW2011_GWA2_44_13]KKT51198.1 MAG: hypothetical protein UW42_C0005G0006 [Candidatus Collierbacteria bacterium GW2011_GWB1_44_197]KKT51979.1 MAG: hypothetical protein UW44_C0005G0021 [Candidatus Collierbacteria bacterium GW2011_GWB2_44_22]KKT62275.1 MAG: hypothetical protein UW56_C0009G0049 [Candidatus Collierbacteria bacterium GW2011_GWD1_44_27]KKT66621.1 MAG: hypothetical protein UW58_C0005G0017 [Candidatus Colli
MKTKQPTLHIILLLIVSVAAGVLFVRTTKTINETSLLQGDVNRQKENVDKLRVLSSTLPGLSSEISTYLITLPANEEDVAVFAATIESVAKDSELTIVNNFDDFPKPVDVSGKNILGLGMEITLEGSFQGLTIFFSKLSDMPYFFKIDKITMLKRDTNTGIKAVVKGVLMMNQEKK